MICSNEFYSPIYYVRQFCIEHHSRSMNSFVALCESFYKEARYWEIIGGFDAYAPALLILYKKLILSAYKGYCF